MERISNLARVRFIGNECSNLVRNGAAIQRGRRPRLTCIGGLSTLSSPRSYRAFRNPCLDEPRTRTRGRPNPIAGESRRRVSERREGREVAKDDWRMRRFGAGVSAAPSSRLELC